MRAKRRRRRWRLARGARAAGYLPEDAAKSLRGVHGGAGRWGLLLAAVVFFLSDLCVARDRFVSPGWENRAVGLPLYFGAQLLYGWFVVQVP